MNAASHGDAALAKSDFVAALQHYTRALVELPRAPAYYIKRSTAYNRLKPADGGPNFQGALQDAEIALVLARDRAKRDLILSAQMRRAVALYQLERYGDAGFLFGLLEEKILGGTGGGDADTSDKVKDIMGGAKSSGPGKGLAQELPIWLVKIKGKLGGLEEGDEKGKVTIEEFPTGVKTPTEKELKKQLEALKAGMASGGGKVQSCTSSATVDKTNEEPNAQDVKEINPPAAAAAAQLPEKIRHEWYQSNDSVVVTLYAKGIAKENVDAELKSDSVSVQFPLPSGSEYAFTLDPLFAPIDEPASKLTTFATKIELVLRKKTPGKKWSSLESPSGDVKLSTTTTTDATAPTVSQSAPSYPTSSRHGAKDWDKLASTLTAKKPKAKKPLTHSHEHSHDKEQEKTEDADDSDDEGSVDSDFGGDPVDGFFKKLYAGADDDTRRAMIKSFTESNGTSLSTNWGEVGKGKVQAYPPSD
ncbi:co-chaperone SGT1 [Aspergillus lucknowensis]|uniref:SGT1 and CS domain protein n=1 Tax=Aspergillus lucknowensis TaxID=176173 RepID=A0ABR4LJB9_9EURO